MRNRCGTRRSFDRARWGVVVGLRQLDPVSAALHTKVTYSSFQDCGQLHRPCLLMSGGLTEGLTLTRHSLRPSGGAVAGDVDFEGATGWKGCERRASHRCKLSPWKISKHLDFCQVTSPIPAARRSRYVEVAAGSGRGNLRCLFALKMY